MSVGRAAFPINYPPRPEETRARQAQIRLIRGMTCLMCKFPANPSSDARSPGSQLDKTTDCLKGEVFRLRTALFPLLQRPLGNLQLQGGFALRKIIPLSPLIKPFRQALRNRRATSFSHRWRAHSATHGNNIYAWVVYVSHVYQEARPIKRTNVHVTKSAIARVAMSTLRWA